MKLRRRRQLVLLLIVGCLTAMALFQDRSSALVSFISGPPELDQVHGIAEGLGLMPAPSLPVTLVLIDDGTFAAWGRPFPMKKARLIPLVEAARAGGARSIVLDIDMSTDSGEADNAALGAYFAAWPAEAPRLLLPRELVFDASSGALREYRTVYDEIIRDRPNIRWINVLFGRGDDLKVRNWNLWEISQTSCTAWLSPQLLLQVEMEAEAGGSAVDNVSRYLSHRERAACPPVDSGSIPGWLQAAPRSAPLQFTFGRSDAPVSSQVIATESGAVPALMQWSALQVEKGQVSSDGFKGRHVIIGGSHGESADMHNTAAGEMEGMRVLANAIANSAVIKLASAPRPWSVDIAGALIGGVVTWAFIRLKAVVAGLAAFVIAVGGYALAARLEGPVAAYAMISQAATMALLAGGLVSIEALLEDLLLRKRGWRSFLGD